MKNEIRMGGVVFAQQDETSHEAMFALENTGIIITTFPLILLLVVMCYTNRTKA